MEYIKVYDGVQGRSISGCMMRDKVGYYQGV